LTLACALDVEERAARRAGAQAARVGMSASLPLPSGRLVSFGLAGALVPGLEPGTVVSATRVVDEGGAVLWEGEPLPVPGAVEGVLCAASRVVDDAGERAGLASRTGAIAVDMESGALAASGRLAGVVRAVSDGPDRPVGRLARAATPDGGTAWGAVAIAFLTQPVQSARASRDAQRALGALESAAAALAEEAS
jgi:nucleoside phosphorylase